MLTNKDSFGYSLAKAADELGKVKGKELAQDFLIRELRLNNFKYWEQLAVIDTYKHLVNERVS